MFRSSALLFALFFFLIADFTSGSLPLSVCPAAPKVVGGNSVSVYSSKESSKWVTTILSQFGTEGSPESPNLDVSQKVIRCDEKEVLQVKVVLREKTEVEYSSESENRRNACHATRVSTLRKDAIHFHESGGVNILVFDDGQTIFRKNEETQVGYGGILTNRPLKDDELFEVKLERLITLHGESIGIGVTKLTPTTTVYDGWMSSSTVMLFNHKIYCDQPKGLYGPDLRKLKVGSCVGVMRRKNGNVHFYVDGVDQGIAAVDVTGPVYGVVDLYGNAVQASIV